MQKGRCPLFLIIAACLLTGCATFSPVMRVDPEMAEVEKIAVFPFENASAEERAGKSMTSVFLSAIHNGGFVEVVESGDVEKFLIKNRIRSTGIIDSLNASQLKEDLGCDAVIVGAVNEYSMAGSGNSLTPAIGISVRLVSAKTGKVLWALSHSRHGADRETAFGVGRVESLSELSEIVCADLLESFKDALTGHYRMPKRITRKIRPGSELQVISAVPGEGIPGNGNGRTREKEQEKERVRQEIRKLFEQIGGK